ncbi:MAG: DEAD/DEAH box helicase [Deltaproteobacteria bacterium]|nr:DEAD/DEAH box helicase [Deltaproteobacteria bacterium]
MADFQHLGIASRILEVLKQRHIVTPTPIQQQSIPIGLEGKDVMGIAQTGTGKTLAFGIPLIQRLDLCTGRALILLPTRELAHQVDEVLQLLARPYQMRSAILIGGESMPRQLQALRQRPRILVATPGRLIDHMEQRHVTLHDIQILVLDEADRMLDMGFAPQLNRIMKMIPSERQTMLFSATMPQPIVKLATNCMSLPVRIEVAPAGSTIAEIEQEVFIIPQASKLQLLESLLQTYHGTVLVFSRTKHGAKKITRVLQTLGHNVTEIHGNRSQSQRRDAMGGFRSGKYRILVATDIAARGIDVSDIEVVINFDLPQQSEDYVHRIGRTGRAGKTGRAISFVTPEQRQEIRAIERLIRKALPVAPLPQLAPSRKIPNLPAPTVSPALRSEGRGTRSHFQPHRSAEGRPATSRPIASGGRPAPVRFARPPQPTSGQPRREGMPRKEGAPAAPRSRFSFFGRRRTGGRTGPSKG